MPCIPLSQSVGHCLHPLTANTSKFLGISQSTLTLVAVHFGLGYHQNHLSRLYLEKNTIVLWVAEQFYILTTAATMISISCLICRITPVRRHHIIGWTIGIMTIIWAIVFWFLRIFICSYNLQANRSAGKVSTEAKAMHVGHLPRPWDPSNKICLNRTAIRLAVTIVGSFLELANVVTAVCVV